VDITRLVRRQVYIYYASYLLAPLDWSISWTLKYKIYLICNDLWGGDFFYSIYWNNESGTFCSQIRIVGSYGGRARQDLPTIVGLADMGFLKIASAVTQKRKLDEADKVYAELDRGEITGRAIIELC
jgi:hypothetical protein